MPHLTDSLPAWMRRFLSSPAGELSRWQRAVRYSIDLAWYCAQALRHDRATEMAAALTYRTIFSLIPIVVLSLVAFGQFADFQKLRDEAQDKALHYLGLDALSYGESGKTADESEPSGDAPPDAQTAPPNPPPDPAAAEQARKTKESDKPVLPPRDTARDKNAQANLVISAINSGVRNIEKLNYKSIGIVGFALLIWGALGLVVALEDSFNRVFGAPVGRSWIWRIVVYWFVLTLGPVLLFLSAYMADRFVGLAEEVRWGSLRVLVGTLKNFSALFVSWMLLLFLYWLMPNARVRLRPAAVGAFVGAVLWEGGKFGFALYVRNALPYSALYGSLGLIPLFLFWVYLTWLIILFGLELTYTLQNMRGRQFKHVQKQSEDQFIDTAWLVPLATRVAEAFREGRPAGATELSRAMGLPVRVIEKMLGALEQGGVIHRVLRGESYEGVSLALPADRIGVDRVLAAGRTLLPQRDGTTEADPAWRLVHRLRDEQPLTHDMTLADLGNGKKPGPHSLV